MQNLKSEIISSRATCLPGPLTVLFDYERINTSTSEEALQDKRGCFTGGGSAPVREPPLALGSTRGRRKSTEGLLSNKPVEGSPEKLFITFGGVQTISSHNLGAGDL